MGVGGGAVEKHAAKPECQACAIERDSVGLEDAETGRGSCWT